MLDFNYGSDQYFAEDSYDIDQEMITDAATIFL
ncbi:MAG: hypothetical protein Ct9H300mP23_06460 [Nitrospinota bacterium]|nr:MAG: hypothetical protein Ct9H300mP23_06460 [Nitrospinota bacterium]